MIIPLIGILICCFPMWDVATTSMGPIFHFENGCIRDRAESTAYTAPAAEPGIVLYWGEGAVGPHGEAYSRNPYGEPLLQL